MRKTFFVLALVVFAMAICCRSDAQDKLTKFRFVHLEANGSQAVPFIAKEAKIFEKNGLDVEIIRIGGGSRVIQAMLAGELESLTARLQQSSRQTLPALISRSLHRQLTWRRFA